MKKLSKKVYIVLLKSGVRYFVDEVNAATIQAMHTNNAIPDSHSIEVGHNQSITKGMIGGIHTPEQIEEADKRRRGEWKCKYDGWHTRYEKCDCGRNIQVMKPEDHPVMKKQLTGKPRSREENLAIMREAAIKAKKAEQEKHGKTKNSKPVEDFLPTIAAEDGNHVCRSNDWIPIHDENGRQISYQCEVCDEVRPV